MTTPSGGIVAFPATTQQNYIVWNGVRDATFNVLFKNTDINNYVYLGYSPNISPNGSNAIPVEPNGSIILGANLTVYAIWSESSGVNPLVVIPGGVGTFLGLTQGLGSLAIPSVQSPNFITEVSGWQISKDGSAEFNNLVIRGVFMGTDFEINSNGAFFYSSSPPAIGNLIASITTVNGTDTPGNATLAGVASYTDSGGIFYATALQSGQINFFTATAATGPWTTFGDIGSDGSTPPNLLIAAAGAAAIVTTSEVQIGNILDIGQDLPPALLASYVRLWADVNSGALKSISGVDGNTYAVGTATNVVPGTITINSTSPIVINSGEVAAISYRVHSFIVYVGGATASSAIIGWDGSATISNVVGMLQHWRGSTATYSFIAAINQNTAIGNETFPFNAGELETYEFEGIVTFSGAGGFNIRGQEATAGDTWQVGINSYLELSPL